MPTFNIFKPGRFFHYPVVRIDGAFAVPLNDTQMALAVIQETDRRGMSLAVTIRQSDLEPESQEFLAEALKTGEWLGASIHWSASAVFERSVIVTGLNERMTDTGPVLVVHIKAGKRHAEYFGPDATGPLPDSLKFKG